MLRHLLRSRNSDLTPTFLGELTVIICLFGKLTGGQICAALVGTGLVAVHGAIPVASMESSVAAMDSCWLKGEGSSQEPPPLDMLEGNSAGFP